MGIIRNGATDFYLESEVDATTSAFENGVDLSEYQFGNPLDQ